MRVPYEDYELQAALVDAGYRDSMPVDGCDISEVR